MPDAPSYVTLCRAKLHGARVTQTELHYEGSITIDMDLVERAGMLPWEKVQVVNQNNGARFDTYIIPGERGSGTLCLNGPAARLTQVGDVVLVIAYSLVAMDESKNWTPTVVLLDENNHVSDVHGV